MLAGAAIRPLSTAAVANNQQALARFRHFVALVAGIAAGTLRLEALYGVGFYVAVSSVCTCLLVAINALRPQDTAKHFKTTFWSLATNTFISAFSGFVLTWVLVYNLVTVY